MEFSLEVEKEFFHVSFSNPVRMLSSAILNGGYQRVSHFVNKRVDANFNGERLDFEQPHITLGKVCQREGWNGFCVGMMTAANMDSLRRVRRCEQGVWIETILTAGVSNARRAGDVADYPFMEADCVKTGTINMLILTNATLNDAAMVECVMMAAEAKAAAMQELGVVSPVSGLIATGTGTDSLAIACGDGPHISYCGKHVLFGELLAHSVSQALKESISQQ